MYCGSYVREMLLKHLWNHHSADDPFSVVSYVNDKSRVTASLGLRVFWSQLFVDDERI